MPDPTVYQRPSELLQHLIRFNTTNPPGNELACVQYLNDLLQAAGIETTLLVKDENRPNLIARQTSTFPLQFMRRMSAFQQRHSTLAQRNFSIADPFWTNQ